MRQPLTRRELSVLRRLGEQIRDEDPELAGQLDHSRTRGPERFLPEHWPPSAYLAIGTAFMTLGVVLDVGSATLGGLFSITVATVRSRSVRRLYRRAVEACEAEFRPPRD